MARALEETQQFKRDKKRIKGAGRYDWEKMRTVVEALINLETAVDRLPPHATHCPCWIFCPRAPSPPGSERCTPDCAALRHADCVTPSCGQEARRVQARRRARLAWPGHRIAAHSGAFNGGF